ncbi:MAG: hypothetical protein AAB556_00765 [Patescibacteria group bacterium]
MTNGVFGCIITSRKVETFASSLAAEKRNLVIITRHRRSHFSAAALEAKVNKKIVLTKRSDDFMAHVENNSEIWSCGKNTDEAIGSLIRTYRELFGIDLRWDMNDIQTKMCLNDPDNIHQIF